MAKITQKDVAQEKMLYSLFLDLSYASDGYADRIEELTDELKGLRKDAAKCKKSLDKCVAQYKELNGGAAPRSHRK